MESVRTYLEQAVEQGAADLFIIAGKNIAMKRGGAFLDATQERVMPADSEKLVRELYALAHRPIPDSILEPV